MSEWVLAVCAVGAFFVSLWNTYRIRELHVVVNSRLTQLLAVTAAASKAEGHLQGLVEGAAEVPKPG